MVQLSILTITDIHQLIREAGKLVNFQQLVEVLEKSGTPILKISLIHFPKNTIRTKN